MKKQLLIGACAFIVSGAYSQVNKFKTSAIERAIEKVSEKFIETETKVQHTASNQTQQHTSGVEKTLSTPSGSWSVIGGSQNIFGVLVSNSKPLQYNAQLNAVSFIHRSSATYSALPANNSGAIVAEISTDWGTTWDSTCVWSSSTNQGRYPQGGIYSAPGSSVMSNAYVIATGPITTGSGWQGSFYGSKQLGAGNYNNTASAAPNAMQFFPNTSATGTVLGHDHSRYSFTSTGDGKIRSMAVLSNDPSGTGTITPGDSAALLMTGSFNAGTFLWSADKFQPNFVKSSDGSFQFTGVPYMAWDSAGVIGYVVLIGALNGETLSNQGLQPVVYKTTNSGASWAQINRIDFNSPAMAETKRSIATINTNTALEIPLFYGAEGIDVTVDANGKLHIVSTIIGTSSEHPDSLGFVFSFPNGGENYRWPHTPGARPYIFDFTGDGNTAWTLRTIDSLSSEVPSSRTTGNGYSENPWDADASNSGAKVSSASRIQLSRTPDGKHIIYSWAESDTAFTNQQKKWNSIPDIKARILNINTGVLSSEVNISKLGTTPNPNIITRSMFHYMSPTASAAQNGQLTIPFTVSTSQPYAQKGSNAHWYISAKLDIAVGIKENNLQSINNSVLYPNPAENSTNLRIDLVSPGLVEVNVFNTIGQLTREIKASAQNGQNEININTQGLESGIYIVKIKIGDSQSSKKLIIK